MTESMISYLGVRLVGPIIELYKILKNMKFSGYSTLRVSTDENGYSTAIILLCATFVESTINRMRYFEGSHERCNLVFFKTRFKDKPIADLIEEIYILRDVLIHNHIWKAEYSYDEQYNEIIQILDKLPEYGDGKYKQNICDKTFQTKNLHLSIIPTKVGKKEVLTVFNVLIEFIELMEKESGLLLNMYYDYDGKHLTFKEFLKTVTFLNLLDLEN